MGFSYIIVVFCIIFGVIDGGFVSFRNIEGNNVVRKMTQFHKAGGCASRKGIEKCIDNKFIRDLEGFTTEGVVPKDSEGKPYPQSGVTVGSGVDLKETTREYFEQLGVPEALIDTIAPYFGLKGQAAQDYLDQHPLVLTYAEAELLTEAVFKAHFMEVQQMYNKVISGSLKCFDELTDAERTVICSVLYQYGNPGRIPRFWGFVTSQDWVDTIAELKDFHDKFPTRRHKEAAKLEGDPGTNSCA